MRAEGVPQARRGDALVQDGEVHRVKGTVAQTRQYRHDHQRGVAVRHARQHACGDEEKESAEQRRTRTQPVHHKARRGLPGARNDEENGHQESELRKAQAELLHEHRKQQRQQQVREVGTGMRQAHQADHGGVLPQRHGAMDLGGDGSGGGGTHESMLNTLRLAVNR